MKSVKEKEIQPDQNAIAATIFQVWKILDYRYMNKN